MMRPVTTAWSPGSLLGEALVSALAEVVAACWPEAAGFMSTGCTVIFTLTGASFLKRWSAPVATHTCTGPRSLVTAMRPLGSTLATVPLTSMTSA